MIFSKQDIDICKKFSEEVDTSFYETRNQFDSIKRKSDSFIGKLGELTVYYYLLDKYPGITYPDFNIYEANQKSWDYDLKHSSFNLHVKTQEVLQSAKFGESWIFQNTDSHIFRKYNKNDYVAFVKVNLYKKEGIVRAIVSLDMLHNNKLFELPLLEKLQDNKLAVYYNDLERFKDQLWQL